jgi:hypothetical protein
MAVHCRWCSRPAARTIVVDAPLGAPRRMALCERHLMDVHRARSDGPDAEERRRRVAEMEAWRRTFNEPPPFHELAD